MNGIPQDLAPYERAARIYCDRTGLDADATVQVPHPLIDGMMVDSWPQWTEVAERLRDLSLLLGSMKQAVAEEKVAS